MSCPLETVVHTEDDVCVEGGLKGFEGRPGRRKAT